MGKIFNIKIFQAYKNNLFAYTPFEWMKGYFNLFMNGIRVKLHAIPTLVTVCAIPPPSQTSLLLTHSGLSFVFRILKTKHDNNYYLLCSLVLGKLKILMCLDYRL